jgi:hypothetical protein
MGPSPKKTMGADCLFWIVITALVAELAFFAYLLISWISIELADRK